MKKKKKNTLKNPKPTNGGGGEVVMDEGKGRKKGNGEREGAEEMNPKLQEAYAFLNELALGLDLRP